MIHIIILAIISITISTLGFLAFLKGKKSISNKSFALFSFSVVIWIITNYLCDVSSQAALALFWNRAAFAAGCLLGVSLCFFALVFPKSVVRISTFWKISIFIGLIIVILTLFTDLVVNRIEFYEWGTNIIGGKLYIPVAIWAITIVGATLVILIRKYKRSQGVVKNQLRYLFLGFFLFLALTMITNMILPVITGTNELAKFGPYSIVFLIGSTTYAIVKHRLMDIRVVITRSILYFILILYVTGAFAFLTFIVGTFFKDVLGANTILVIIGMSFLIVISLDSLKRYVSKVTDQIFFKARVDYREILRKLSQIISIELDLDKLVNSLVSALTQELKIKEAYVLIYHPKKNIYQGHKGFISNHHELRLTLKNPLVQYLKRGSRIIVTEELEREIADATSEVQKKKLNKVYTELQKMDAALTIPAFLKGQLKAILILGPKLSGDVFDNEDIKMFEVLAPQVATAAEKASLYEEVRNFSRKLKGEVDKATEDLRVTNITLEEANRNLATLRRFSDIILHTLRLEDMTQNVINTIPKEIQGCDMGILVLKSKIGNKLYAKTISQDNPIAKKIFKLLGTKLDKYTIDLKKDSNLATQAVLTRQIQISDKLSDFISPPINEKLARVLQNVGGAMSKAVGVPLAVGKEVLGILVFTFSKKKPEITEDDLRMIKAVADEVAIAIERAQIYEELQTVNAQLKEANFHLRELDKAKSEFMSIASHQLRTPLSGIMGYLSMLIEGDYGKLPPEIHKILGDLLEASRRLIRLVNVFLNVTRIEAGRLQLSLKPIAIESVIESALTEFKIPVADKKLYLKYEKPKIKLPNVIADIDKIKDVLFNLVDNALKYSNQGGVTISAKANRDFVTISVKDTGIGIKKDEAKRLFNKFVRGSGMARIQPDGSGLGLYIAKMIIGEHKGKIWVESKGKNKGSTFSFSLPVAK